MSNKLTKRREPFEFMLWLGMFSSALLFLFVFLVFIKKEWMNQEIPLTLPLPFHISTLAILLSSITMYLGNFALKNDNYSAYRTSLAVTYILALGFLAIQLLGWKMLIDQQITPATHTGGSFLYILSGLHILHTLGGLVGLSLVIAAAFRNTSYVDAFVHNVNPPNVLRFRLVTVYWHFLGVLWFIIYLFLLWNAS